MRDSSSKIWLLVLAVIIIGIVYWRWTNPPKTQYNWSKTYTEGENQPYDFGVFQSMLQHSSKGQFRVFSNGLKSGLPEKNIENSTYVFIGREAFYSDTDIVELLRFVEKGADVWISTEALPDTILQIIGGDDTSLLMGLYFSKQVKVNCYNQEDTAVSFNWKVRSFDKQSEEWEWNYISGTNFNFNAFPRGNVDEGLNYIEYRRGKGKLYLHTSPVLFTNYCLKNDTGFMYLSSVFDGIELKDIYYDLGSRKLRDEKAGKGRGGVTPLSYILSQRSLRWAWYLFVTMLVLFFIFYTKRKQKVISVLPSKSNFSLRFMDTLLALHLKQGNYKYMSELNMGLFMTYVKQKFAINISEIETGNFILIADKSGVSLQSIDLLFERYKQIQNSDIVSADMFLELNRLIRQFKKSQKIK